MGKSTFDPFAVRQSIRHKYCGEYDLPSGKPSGYYRYPITTAEVLDLTSDFSDDELKESSAWAFCQNISEVRLWVALRKKYGLNYLAPVKWQFWLNDSVYDPPPAKNPIYDKIELLENAIYNETQNVFEELSARINDLKHQKEQKDFKKMFDDDLTTNNSML